MNEKKLTLMRIMNLNSNKTGVEIYRKLQHFCALSISCQVFIKLWLNNFLSDFAGYLKFLNKLFVMVTHLIDRAGGSISTRYTIG